MKKALVPVIVLLVIGAVISFAIMPSTPAASKKIQENIAQVMGSGKAVFLQLSSSGCITCRKMEPAIEKIASEYASSGKVKVIKIDVDSHSSLASKYGVTGVPTQVLLSPEGSELFRNMGYMSYDNIKFVFSSKIKS